MYAIALLFKRQGNDIRVPGYADTPIRRHRIPCGCGCAALNDNLGGFIRFDLDDFDLMAGGFGGELDFLAQLFA